MTKNRNSPFTEDQLRALNEEQVYDLSSKSAKTKKNETSEAFSKRYNEFLKESKALVDQFTKNYGINEKRNNSKREQLNKGIKWLKGELDKDIDYKKLINGQDIMHQFDFYKRPDNIVAAIQEKLDSLTSLDINEEVTSKIYSSMQHLIDEFKLEEDDSDVNNIVTILKRNMNDLIQSAKTQIEKISIEKVNFNEESFKQLKEVIKIIQPEAVKEKKVEEKPEEKPTEEKPTEEKTNKVNVLPREQKPFKVQQNEPKSRGMLSRLFSVIGAGIAYLRDAIKNSFTRQKVDLPQSMPEKTAITNESESALSGKNRSGSTTKKVYKEIPVTPNTIIRRDVYPISSQLTDDIREYLDKNDDKTVKHWIEVINTDTVELGTKQHTVRPETKEFLVKQITERITASKKQSSPIPIKQPNVVTPVKQDSPSTSPSQSPRPKKGR